MMLGKSFGIVGFVAATTLSSCNAFPWPYEDNPAAAGGIQTHSHMRPNPSRILLDSADSPSLTEDGPPVYRYYEENFVINLYGLTELLSAPDAQVFQEATKAHLNKRLRDSPVDLRVSSTRVLDQKQVENEIPILSLSLRILGQAVSTDAKAVASLSFQDAVLDIFAKNPSELSRALKDDSDAFDNLLIPEASLLDPTSVTSGSGDKDLVVLISASVGAAVFTAIVLGVCLWRQRGGRNSKAVDDMLKKDEGELEIASTWSSSDASSSKEPPVTPPKLRSFPCQERKALSPCIEELVGVDEGQVHDICDFVCECLLSCDHNELTHHDCAIIEQEQEDSSASSQEGMFSIKNWTYSSVSRYVPWLYGLFLRESHT